MINEKYVEVAIITSVALIVTSPIHASTQNDFQEAPERTIVQFNRETIMSKEIVPLESYATATNGITLYPVPNTIEEEKKIEVRYHYEYSDLTLTDICKHPLINQNLEKFLKDNEQKDFSIGDSINIHGNEIKITINHKRALDGIFHSGAARNYFWLYLNYENKEETNNKIARALTQNTSAKVGTVSKCISLFKAILGPINNNNQRIKDQNIAEPIMTAIPIMTPPSIMEEEKKIKLGYRYEYSDLTLTDICKHPLINKNLEKFLKYNEIEYFDIGDIINIHGNKIKITKNHKNALNGIFHGGAARKYFWLYLNYENKKETNNEIARALTQNSSAKIGSVSKCISLFKAILGPINKRIKDQNIAEPIMTAIPVMTPPSIMEEEKKNELGYHYEYSDLTLTDICKHPLINKTLENFLKHNKHKDFHIGDIININGNKIKITGNYKSALKGILNNGAARNYFWLYLNYENKEEENNKIAEDLTQNSSANSGTVANYISLFKAILGPINNHNQRIEDQNIAEPIMTPPSIMTAIPVVDFVPNALPVYEQDMQNSNEYVTLLTSGDENPVRKKRRLNDFVV